MPTVEATCSCPFCRTAYPLLPQLVGRPIRCRSCKGVFQVDEAGITTPVIVNRPDRQKSPEATESPAALTDHTSSSFYQKPATTKPGTGHIRDKMRRSLQSGRFHAVTASEDDGDDPAAAGATAFTAADAVSVQHQPKPPPRPTSTRFYRKKTGSNSAKMSVAIRNALKRAQHESLAAPSSGDSSASGTRPPSMITAEPGQMASCPHCHTERPFDHADIDQLIRCAECQGVYRVFENGQTTPAIVNRPLAPRRRPTRAAKDSLQLLDESDEPTPQSTLPKAPRRKPGMRGSRIMQTKDLIAEMNGRLKDFSAKIPDEPEPAKGSKRPAAEIDSLLKPHARVRLTGEGHADGRLRQWWWAAAAGLIGVILLIAWQSRSIDPARQALLLFIADCSYQNADKARESIARITHRAWSTPAVVHPVVNCDLAELEKPWSVDLADVAPLRDLVKDRFLFVPCGLWCPLDVRTIIEERWHAHVTAGLPAEAFPAILAEAAFDVLPHARLIESLNSIALPPVAREVLRLILAPDNGSSGSVFQDEFIRKPVPQTMEGQPFHGDDGRLLLPTGGTLIRRYRGLLIRFVRKDMPEPWRVFHLAIVAE